MQPRSLSDSQAADRPQLLSKELPTMSPGVRTVESAKRHMGIISRGMPEPAGLLENHRAYLTEKNQFPMIPQSPSE